MSSKFHFYGKCPPAISELSPEVVAKQAARDALRAKNDATLAALHYKRPEKTQKLLDDIRIAPLAPKYDLPDKGFETASIDEKEIMLEKAMGAEGENVELAKNPAGMENNNITHEEE